MNKRKSNCLDMIKVRLMVALLSRALPSLGKNISCTTSGTDQPKIHEAASRGFTYNQGFLIRNSVRVQLVRLLGMVMTGMYALCRKLFRIRCFNIWNRSSEDTKSGLAWVHLLSGVLIRKIGCQGTI